MTQDCNRVTELLVARPDCDVNARTSDGESALFAAAHAGLSVRVVQLLLSRPDADVNARAYAAEGGPTVLMAAVASRSVGPALLLLQRTDIRVGDTKEGGDTALHLAAYLGESSICRRILQIDGSVATRKNRRGVTPADLAAIRGHSELAAIIGKQINRRSDLIALR